MEKKVIVIIGPTASGKSTLAINLAKRINGVVISADSMQIYKGLNVGTAKVTKEEMDGVEHRLIDICEISEKFDVAKYKTMCMEQIEDILSKGKTPIIAGGTGLYINAVVNNVEFKDIYDASCIESIKYEIEKLDETMSTEELYNYLASIDKVTALSIDGKNRRRVLRAIEYALNGKSKVEEDSKSSLWKQNLSMYNFYTFSIEFPRDLLYDRINKRVDIMIANGVLDEAYMLYNNMLKENVSSNILQAIGYKEFFPYFKGEASLEDCIESLKLNTRHYAKRQITWFKKLGNKTVIDGTKSQDILIEHILGEVYGEKK